MELWRRVESNGLRELDSRAKGKKLEYLHKTGHCNRPSSHMGPFPATSAVL